MPVHRTTGESIRSYLSYCPETGKFFWVKSNSNRTTVGQVASNVNTTGYGRIRFDSVLYLAHRLAWWFYYDCWPKGQVDHINGDRTDNRIANLRLATQSQQNQNRNPKGVCFDKQSGKYKAQLKINGKRVLNSLHAEEAEARAAYTAAKLKHHEYNDRLVI